MDLDRLERIGELELSRASLYLGLYISPVLCVLFVLQHVSGVPWASNEEYLTAIGKSFHHDDKGVQ